MSEDTTDTSPQSKDDGQDPVKQLKSEFSRKQKETNEVLSQIQATQAALQATLEKLARPAPAPKKEDEASLEEIMYSDPKEYARRIKEDAKREALELMRSESSSQESVKQAIAGLYNEYPELSDDKSDLTKATVEILKGVSDAEKTNPRTYEFAVLKAAQSMDVKPRSKRPTQEEEFVAPSYTSPQARSKKRSSDQVVSQNKDIAKTFGLNLDDPKTKEKYINLLKAKGLA